MKITLITILTFMFSTAFAQDHDHHSTPAKTSSKHLEQKEKFKPTEDLKVRMEKILNLTKELKEKKNDSKSVVEYGDKISAVVSDIFKTCKLEPEADAAIHPTLALLLDGTKELKNRKYQSGSSKIHQALLDYEKNFSHEGWKL